MTTPMINPSLSVQPAYVSPLSPLPVAGNQMQNFGYPIANQFNQLPLMSGINPQLQYPF